MGIFLLGQMIEVFSVQPITGIIGHILVFMILRSIHLPLIIPVGFFLLELTVVVFSVQAIMGIIGYQLA